MGTTLEAARWGQARPTELKLRIAESLGPVVKRLAKVQPWRKPTPGLANSCPVHRMICQGVHMKILIAEDDAVARMLLTRTLHKYDYEVVAVTDGRQAWEKLKGAHFPILISDWMMPEMDGLELCRTIRQSVSENSAESCFRAKGRMARRNEGEYPPWIFD